MGGSLVNSYCQSTVQWTTNYYSVTGTTLREIQQSLEENRPWKDNIDVHGATAWRIEWRFDVRTTAGGCRVQRFTTRTAIRLTMPRWVAPKDAAQPVAEAWQRYTKALEQHELGHCQVALAAAAELQKKVNALTEEPDCEALGQRINGIGQKVIADYRQRDSDYDRRTNHGATQGARLRRSPPEPRP